MEDSNNTFSESSTAETTPGDKVRSAIMAVVAHSIMPVAFIGFCVCVVPVFVQKADQFNIVPCGNVLVLFNISGLISEHIFHCLGLLYIILSLDAVLCLVLFGQKRTVLSSVWSWGIIIVESVSIIFCISILYEFLGELVL